MRAFIGVKGQPSGAVELEAGDNGPVPDPDQLAVEDLVSPRDSYDPSAEPRLVPVSESQKAKILVALNAAVRDRRFPVELPAVFWCVMSDYRQL